jgi:hypothetical protein
MNIYRFTTKDENIHFQGNDKQNEGAQKVSFTGSKEWFRSGGGPNIDSPRVTT